MMASLRKRIPFKLGTDAQDEDDHVLDEQEQEEVIKKLRESTITSNFKFSLVVQASTGFSVFLHFLFFIDPSPESLLIPFFPTTPPEPAIPLVRLFALTHILLQFNLLLHLVPERTWLRDVPHVPVPVITTLVLSLVAPMLSVMLGKHWQQTIWWSSAAALSCVVHMRLRWLEEEKASIEELEKLRYDARGA